MVEWVHERGMQMRQIEPGKPNQNDYIESLNGDGEDESCAYSAYSREAWIT